MMIFDSKPSLVNFSEKTFSNNRLLFGNCLRGCKWAPDGSCIGTNSEDHQIRIFNLPGQFCSGSVEKVLPAPEINPDLELKESQIIYDFCWYPLMNSTDFSTCFRDVPIHLWDAYSGKISASYTAFNNVYELVSARSINFNFDGSKIIAGYEKFICCFDISRPGETGEYICDIPNGIVSCLTNNTKIVASGSFNKLIGLYDLQSLENIATLRGHQGGVTHISISPDGNRLYSGARKDNEILCWDLRNYGTILHVINRSCNTNQRFYFDINFDQNVLVTGDNDGQIAVYDLNSESLKENKVLSSYNQFESHNNCVNGVGLHPSLPLIASTSGQRCLLDFNEDNDDIMFDYRKSYIMETSLKFWWFD